MKRVLVLCLTALALVRSTATTFAADFADRSAAELLPNTAVVYAELPDPGRLLKLILDHPLRAKLEQQEGYQRAMASPDYGKLKAVKALVELQLGQDWRSALQTLTGGGIYAALDSRTQGLALLVRSTDNKLLVRARDLFLTLAREDARNKGLADPIKPFDYRDVPAHRLNEARMAVLGPWLLLTNNDELGKHILDTLLDGPRPGKSDLAADEQFTAARRTRTQSPAGWVYVKLSTLRDAGLAGKLFSGKADDPVGELLLGGILGDLTKAPYATAALHASQDRLQLELSMPHDPAWTAPARQYYFGPRGKGAAPAPLHAKDELLTVSTYRDVSSLWSAAGELFEESINAKFVQADSQLSTLFSGRNFSQDVLGAVRPELQLVAARQKFTAAEPTPDIKLPALALVLRLKEPEKMQRQLKVSFQSIVGFANVAGAQSGQPQLELSSEKLPGGQLVSASYPADEDKNAQGRINFNFSPALGFAGDRLILSSARTLAAELMDQKTLVDQKTNDQPNPADGMVANTLAKSNLGMLAQVLNDNRQQLISHNMLEKGHDKQQAEKEVGLFLELLSWLQDASLRLDTSDNHIRLQAAIDLAKSKN